MAGELRLDDASRSDVFVALPTPYVVLSPQLTMLDMNDAYLQVTGRDRAELIGRYFLEAFPPPSESMGPDGRSELQVSLERVRDTGRPDTLPVQKYPIAGPDGVLTERHWLAVHVPVLAADGSVRFLVQRTEDITEFSVGATADDSEDWRGRLERVENDLYVRARELADAVAAKDVAARQVASLAEASLALAAASSLEEVERIVVSRALPVLGSDGGGIVSPGSDGDWRIVTNEALGEHVQTIYPSAPYDSMIPGCWSARTGERLLLPTRASGLAFDADVLSAIYENTGRLGWAFVPLTVGDRRLGSLAVSWVDEHELSPDELDLLDGFAAQCAQALLRIETEQAQREAAQEVQQLAEALQQALLTPPPEPDHLHVVTRYRPAGHHAQIGGDWYDAFLQPGGDTMLVIGDVVGHDSSAAAKMGQLRGVLRTLAFDTAAAPADVLNRLDRTARGLAVDALATTVLARVEQPTAGTGRVMRWSNAGHPPPLLLHADGRVDVLETEPELLLGFSTTAVRTDHRIELPDDSTLLLYTDGLIERRNETFDDAIVRLTATLADLARLDVEELCDALLDRLGTGDDDIALVAVRVQPGGVPRDAGTHTEIELPFDTASPALARHFVVEHAAELTEEVRHSAELLVSELVTNAVRHGRPGVRLQLRAEAGALGIMVTDHGEGEPALPDRQPDASATSGRGLLIIAAIADDWGVRRNDADGSKTVWFELREPGT